jgi:hypothetical protein
MYECSFKVASKKYSCLINDDDGEHIALVDAEPRERLIEAIEQDCSRIILFTSLATSILMSLQSRIY